MLNFKNASNESHGEIGLEFKSVFTFTVLSLFTQSLLFRRKEMQHHGDCRHELHPKQAQENLNWEILNLQKNMGVIE